MNDTNADPAPAGVEEAPLATAGGWRTDIPTIDGRRLTKLCRDIRPVRREGRRYRFHARVSPYEACVWGVPTGKLATLIGKVGEPVRTLHEFAAPSFFKPTMEEIMAQMPSELEGRVNAFTIEYRDFEQVIPEGGDRRDARTYHRAEVQFLRVM